MKQNKSNNMKCDILAPKLYLENKDFNMWDCYSEYESSYNDHLHFHNFFELSVIYEGTSQFLINGELFTMGNRSLQLIRPSDYHKQLTGNGEHIRYYNLMFSAEFLSEPLQHELEKVQQPLCATVGIAEWDDMIRMIRKIYKEFKESSEDILSRIYIRANVENLCIFLLKNQKVEHHLNIQVPQEPIRKAVSYVQKSYRNPIHLSDAANAAGLSPTYFSMVFHSTMGITFSRYLTEYRLQIAERYLRSSDLPIKQIAAVCGFSSYPYFVTLFKEHFGVPPGSWRSKIQKQ